MKLSLKFGDHVKVVIVDVPHGLNKAGTKPLLPVGRTDAGNTVFVEGLSNPTVGDSVDVVVITPLAKYAFAKVVP